VYPTTAGHNIEHMVHINDLPNELLRDIFTEGCKDNLQWSIEYPQFDFRPDPKPKYFAKLSSSVCTTWRNMIDFPNNEFFWISIPRLSLNVRKNESAFIHELIRFRDQLTRSKGCDLVINFAAFRLNNDGLIFSGEISVNYLVKKRIESNSSFMGWASYRTIRNLTIRERVRTEHYLSRQCPEFIGSVGTCRDW